MSKRKKKKSQKSIVPKMMITEIEKSRVGGAVALTGFDYQCLYSCYAVLNYLTSDSVTIQFEGIEDIDIYAVNATNYANYIQIKHSIKRQNASFLQDIFKNYLEVYLRDCPKSNRRFILVYDFDIADGYFKKLVQHKKEDSLDKQSILHWTKVIDSIKEKNSHWDWEGFQIADFINQLSFEYIATNSLRQTIESNLIDKFQITSGNEILYARSLYYFCFSKMKSKQSVNKNELEQYILGVKDEISKGVYNPAVQWIKPIEFDCIDPIDDSMYFEGKKATPSDIVAGLPVPRPHLENSIKESINNNTITVIKASSGQGKTTLAWRVAYEERSHYSIYQILWCMDTKELDYIVEFIRSRIKVGEIPLIIFDNLDAQLREWNKLAQLLYTNLGSNYKLLITSRESDWYTYSGDQSNLRNLKIHNIELDEKQAQEIYSVFSTKGKVHPNIYNWQSAWEQINQQGLLIEYVYLITHGEMLAERITAQMKEMEQQEDRDLKFDVLRKVCFADTLGINLSSEKLCAYYDHKKGKDITSIIRSFKNEYLITTNNVAIYISGLHPVRSQHLLDIVHQYSSKANTILDLLEIIDSLFVSKLYANIPLYTSEDDREEFYQALTQKTATKSYQYYLDALRGIYSGSIYTYYKKNREIFDDVNKHGGLEIFLVDINPYSKFNKFDVEIQTLTDMHKILPNDDNISYLKSLADSIEKFNIRNSDYYVYSHYLYYNVLKDHPLKSNKYGFSTLVYWMVNVDIKFNVLSADVIKQFWNERNTVDVSILSELMFSWYLADESEYIRYVECKKTDIITFLKMATQSIRLYEQSEDHSIHVEYLLLPSEIQSGNKESVERLNLICKFLPIYDFYCADSIRPQSDFLDSLKTPDDSHKKMPKRNLIISFHQEYANLWSHTILSNYEAPTIFDWLDFWITTRTKILLLCRKTMVIIDKRLNQKKIALHYFSEFDVLRDEIILRLKTTYPYPRQNRPFEQHNIPSEAQSIPYKYFPSIRTYFQQVVGLLQYKEKEARLAIFNLRKARIELNEMQAVFRAIAERSGYYTKSSYANLTEEETECVGKLLSYSQYYVKHPSTRIVTSINISRWYEKQSSELISQAQEFIENNKLFSMCFEYPLERIDDGTLFTLPMISKDIDLTNSDNSIRLIFTLLPLAELEIDFIIIIFKSSQNDLVKQIGVRFSKNFLINTKKAVEDNDDSHLDNSYLPLPIMITNQMLEVFETKYDIEVSKTKDEYDVLIEELWKYSQLKEYIFEPEYLEKMQDTIRSKINTLFSGLSMTQSMLYEYTKNKIKTVLDEGQDFNNKDFNDAFNLIIQEAR